MKVYVDSENRIKAVDSTTDTSLTELTINDETNPFKDWSIAKICCYKVTVVDGIVTMMTPYADSRMIEHIDQLGNQVEAVTPYKAVEKASAGETEVTFVGVPEGKTLTTVVKDLEGNFIDHNTTKSEDIVKVFFEPLTYAADITLSIN